MAYCSAAEKHTLAPDGYLAWHDWAAKKSKTHRQERCPCCGLFMIWVPKKPRQSLAKDARAVR